MKLKKWIVAALAIVTTVGVLAGCGADTSKQSAAPAEKKEITVGITPGSSDQIMEVVKKEAAKQGLTVNVKTFNDYITPDQALASGDIDLNMYQHQPFLDNMVKERGLHLTSIGKTILLPMGLYSNKIHSLDDIKADTKIAIPNDPSNGGRALVLLEKAGIIKEGGTAVLAQRVLVLQAAGQQVACPDLVAPAILRGQALVVVTAHTLVTTGKEAQRRRYRRIVVSGNTTGLYAGQQTMTRCEAVQALGLGIDL